MTAPPDDVSATVALAKSRLAEMAQSGAMARDPYRMALGVLVAVVDALAAHDRAGHDGRHPLTPREREALAAELVEAVSRGAVQGASGEARSLARRMDRRLAVQVGALVAGAFVAGGLAVAAVSYFGDTGRWGRTALADAAWAALLRDNPDPRPALKMSGVQADASGRRFYPAVPLWAEPAAVPAGRR